LNEQNTQVRGIRGKNEMKQVTTFRDAVLCVSAAVTVFGADVAGAQETEEQSLDTVVVTAERREMNLQSTPIAVSVLNGEALQEKSVTQMSDLQFATPSLTINNDGIVEGVNIRGIGLTSDSPRAAPGVAVYRDGVLVPQILNQTTFFDIGSVEVLRGPQGTFTGSYSTGGAMFINSRDPDLGDVNGYVTAGAGDYSSYNAGGAVNLPLSDTFATRLAFDARQHDSYYDFVRGGGGDPQPGGLEEISVRIGTLWKPTEKFSTVLKLEGVDRKAGGRAQRPQPGSIYAPLVPADPRTLDFDIDQFVDEKTARASWRSDYEFGNGLILRSTTGGNYSNADNFTDQDGSAGAVPPNNLGSVWRHSVYERTASQELNLISPADWRFSWVMGAYVYQTEIDLDLGIFNGPAGGGAQTLNIDTFTRKGNHGFFVHGRYDITPSLEGELGVRWSHAFTRDQGTVSVLNAIAPGINLVLPSDGRHTDDVVTGKAGLNWEVNDNNYLFGFVARGFKPGTSNASSGTVAPAFLANPGLPGGQVDHETVTDYELGWRTTLFDRAVRVQTGVFYSDYKDFQIDTIDLATGQGGLVNADSATLYGFEAQAQIYVGGFRSDFGLAYVNSEVDSAILVDESIGVSPPPGAPLPQCRPPSGASGTRGAGCWNYATFNVAGNEMQYAPDWTFTAGAQYDFVIGNGGTLTPRVNYSYIGAQWGSFQSLPEDLIRSRSVLSASLTYEVASWRARAFVNNLTDALFVTGFSGQSQFFGAPRTYGLEVTKNF
jgi:iron complex outermembrane recepter protein